MSEIDDLYNEKLESLENNFFEDFKKGKDRKKAVDSYHENLEKLIISFEKQYNEFLEKERKEANKKKEKKEEEIKYSSLEVKHFDFQTSRFERIKARLKLFLFKTGRLYRRTVLAITPSTLIYFNYKLKIILRNFFSLIKENFIKIIEAIWHLIVRVYYLFVKGIIELLHSIFKFFKAIFLKIKPKKTEKNAEKKNEEEKDKKESQN